MAATACFAKKVALWFERGGVEQVADPVRLRQMNMAIALAASRWNEFAGDDDAVGRMNAWLDEVEPQAGPHQFLRAYRAWSLARLGRFDEAREIIAVALEQQAERGGGPLLANLYAFESVGIELLAGDPSAAVTFVGA